MTLKLFETYYNAYLELVDFIDSFRRNQQNTKKSWAISPRKPLAMSVGIKRKKSFFLLRLKVITHTLLRAGPVPRPKSGIQLRFCEIHG